MSSDVVSGEVTTEPGFVCQIYGTEGEKKDWIMGNRVGDSVIFNTNSVSIEKYVVGMIKDIGAHGYPSYFMPFFSEYGSYEIYEREFGVPYKRTWLGEPMHDR